MSTPPLSFNDRQLSYSHVLSMEVHFRVSASKILNGHKSFFLGRHERQKTDQHGGKWLSRPRMVDPADHTMMASNVKQL